MNFSKDYIKQKLQLPLRGRPSHIKMAPPQRALELKGNIKVPNNVKKSAVMMLFFRQNDTLKMIVIRRSEYVGIHSGQIAFPGGRYEESDKNLSTTALREIQEEIGIPDDKIEIIGRLSDIYVPPSNFVISVFVGWLDQTPQYTIDEREVAEVIEIPFDEFDKPDLIKTKDFYVDAVKEATNAPYYDLQNAKIWGASAMVISELIDMLNNNTVEAQLD